MFSVGFKKRLLVATLTLYAFGAVANSSPAPASAADTVNSSSIVSVQRAADTSQSSTTVDDQVLRPVNPSFAAVQNVKFAVVKIENSDIANTNWTTSSPLLGIGGAALMAAFGICLMRISRRRY